MAITLTGTNALNPGSDLWVIPDQTHSNWSRRLDWYLNFQIIKLERHQFSHPSPTLENILKETGLPQNSYRTKTSDPILISSALHFPNRWVLVYPFENSDLNKWIQNIIQFWLNLNRPSLRIFLPNGILEHKFHESWQKNNEFQDYSCVLDSIQ